MSKPKSTNTSPRAATSNITPRLPFREAIFATSPYLDFEASRAYFCEGWGGTAPIFADLIAEVRPKLIFEIGTWLGQSALTMADAVKAQGLATEIVCVDTWLGAAEFWLNHADPTRYRRLKLVNGYPSVYYQFLTNVVHRDHADVITPAPMTSSVAATLCERLNLWPDLVYIDGSHEPLDIQLDLRAWVTGRTSVIFGHDVKSWITVRTAVENFRRTIPASWRYEERDDWWIIRTRKQADG